MFHLSSFRASVSIRFELTLSLVGCYNPLFVSTYGSKVLFGMLKRVVSVSLISCEAMQVSWMDCEIPFSVVVVEL